MTKGSALPRTLSQAGRPAGVLIRLAAMTYEGVLLFGVVFVVGYAVLALAQWTYPLAGFRRAVLQAIAFGATGLYFVYQWTHSGQTLAMKAWNLRLVDSTERPPRFAAALLRYLLAWHLVLPGVIWSALFGGRGLVDAAMFGVGFVCLLVPAWFDARHRLLHDRLSATRIIRER